MSTRDDHLLNLRDELLQINDDELYTGDGSVDFNGKPVLKSKTGNWRACIFILGNEGCERLAFTGIRSSLVTYLTQQMHKGNASAAKIANSWSGTCYLAPLVGAFLADSYWGRYRTISGFSIVYIIGLCALTLSASFPAFQAADSVDSASPSTSPQYSLFFVGLYLIAVGTGGIKPCVPSFGADQFDDTDTHELVKKGSFFNWFYFSISIGSLVSSSLLVWIQENVGWGIGYGIPALCMIVAVAIFLSGTPFYRFQRPGGSPLTSVCQVIVASIRKCKLNTPRDISLLYEASDTGSRKLEHTEGLEFLDKAATVTEHEMKKGDFLSNPRRLCTITQVEELKILIRLFPTWATGIVDFAVAAESSATFVEQGMMMDRRVGSFTIPAASLATCTMIASLVSVPIYENTLVPLARKFTGKERGISELQRIGIGLCLSVLAMVIATLVETRRLKLAEELGLVNESVAIPLSILWQVPQYVILGIADVFVHVGRLEFVNHQSPDSMRSLCTASLLLSMTLGCYLSPLVLTIVTNITAAGGKPGWVPDNLNQGRLDNYFGLWTGLSFVNLLVYVLCAMRYKQKEVKNVG